MQSCVTKLRPLEARATLRNQSMPQTTTTTTTTRFDWLWPSLFQIRFARFGNWPQGMQIRTRFQRPSGPLSAIQTKPAPRPRRQRRQIEIVFWKGFSNRAPICMQACLRIALMRSKLLLAPSLLRRCCALVKTTLQTKLAPPPRGGRRSASARNETRRRHPNAANQSIISRLQFAPLRGERARELLG